MKKRGQEREEKIPLILIEKQTSARVVIILSGKILLTGNSYSFGKGERDAGGSVKGKKREEVRNSSGKRRKFFLLAVLKKGTFLSPRLKKERSLVARGSLRKKREICSGNQFSGTSRPQKTRGWKEESSSGETHPREGGLEWGLMLFSRRKESECFIQGENPGYGKGVMTKSKDKGERRGSHL